MNSNTPVKNSESKKKSDTLLKTLQDAVQSSWTLGLILTMAVVVSSISYLEWVSLHESRRSSHAGFGFLQTLQLKYSDLRMQLRGPIDHDLPLALVAIDDRSIEKLGRWPWSRTVMAEMLDRLLSLEAASVGMDIVFSEPEKTGELKLINKLKTLSTSALTTPNPPTNEKEVLDSPAETAPKGKGRAKTGGAPSGGPSKGPSKKLKKGAKNGNDHCPAGQPCETKTNIEAQLRKWLEEEEQKSDPDRILAQVIEKHKDRLVLGAFAEDSSSGLTAYQDYCRNAAFQKYHADQFVKLNASFIVEDTADSYVELDFTQYFEPFFESISKARAPQILKESFGSSDPAALDELNLRRFRTLLYQENLKYCSTWLTDQDPSKDVQSQGLAQLLAQVEAHKNLDPLSSLELFKGNVRYLPVEQRTLWTINTEKLQAAADFTGSFVANQDIDGTIRRMNLFFRTGNKVSLSFIPSLSLQTFLVGQKLQARLFLDADPKNKNQKRIRSLEIYDQSTEPETLYAQIPVDENGQLKINYFGGRQHFAYVPAHEILSSQDTMKIEKSVWSPTAKTWNIEEIEVNKKEFIKGRSFLVGATAIGVYDLRVTPLEKNFPGPEIHMNVMGNLMARKFLAPVKQEKEFLPWILLALGLITTTLVSWWGASVGALGIIALILAMLGLDRLFFNRGYEVQFVLPFLQVLGIYIVLTFFKYLTEERKKRHLRSTFSKYVSPAIVDEILKDPSNVELGGRKQFVSVFFSDVRGFTSISEKLDPQKLSEVLNLYLTPMTQLVFKHRGTLDKYMGDAIMSFFGAPVFFSEHAVEACRCALESLEKLKSISAHLQSLNLPPIDIGIGINSAEVSVGNMGSDIVRNYTVMGDGVNLASRLEGINKEYGTRIVISQFTYDLVKDQMIARELDWVRVKGKSEPVKIFELLGEGVWGPEEQNKQDWLSTYNSAYSLYRDRQFAKALEVFQLAAEKAPYEDPVIALYTERCQEYLTNPPEPNWDGVYNLKTK